jgi:hypothetical protein
MASSRTCRTDMPAHAAAAGGRVPIRHRPFGRKPGPDAAARICLDRAKMARQEQGHGGAGTTIGSRLPPERPGMTVA